MVKNARMPENLRMPYQVFHYNGQSERCDMLRGPCCCGATHQPEEIARSLTEADVFHNGSAIKVEFLIRLATEQQADSEITSRYPTAHERAQVELTRLAALTRPAPVLQPKSEPPKPKEKEPEELSRFRLLEID